jgi:hypothetical protein
MSSSPDDLSLEARKFLSQAANHLVSDRLTGGVSDAAVALSQAHATTGLGYAVLAVLQYLPNLEPRPG